MSCGCGKISGSVATMGECLSNANAVVSAGMLLMLERMSRFVRRVGLVLRGRFMLLTWVGVGRGVVCSLRMS